MRDSKVGARNGVRGFTLIELTIVIGLIALLIILILPAVNSAIESARRSKCQATQAKLALAMSRFNAIKDFLPGWRNDITTAGMPGTVDWFNTSLPYLERDDVYQAILDGTVFTVANVGVTTSTFDELIDLTRCPSTQIQKDYRGFGMQFLANAGSVPGGTTPFNMNDGVLGDNANGDHVSLDDIRKGDGQSNTLLITETLIRQSGDTMFWDLSWPPTTADIRLEDGKTPVPSTYPGAFKVGSAWVRRIPSVANTGLAFGFANISSVTATTQVINQGVFNRQAPSPPLVGLHVLPKSRHEGGCYSAFVDGSTRFLKNDLAPHVYGHLVTSRSVYSASGPTGQKYVVNSTLANKYLAAPSYTGAPPYVLESTDY